jgi:hypothetical protein
MKKYNHLFCVAFCVLFLVEVKAQVFEPDTIKLKDWVIDGYSITNTIFNLDGPVPFWFCANNSGRYNREVISEQSWINMVTAKNELTPELFIGAGIEIVSRGTFNESFFNQLYLKLTYKKFLFRIGKETYTLAQYNDELGIGSMVQSKNSRAVPRLGAGFYDYSPVPFTGGNILFKGAIQFGRLNDNRGEKGTKKPWLHEKFFYLKTSHTYFNFWIGLNHSVLMGGTYPDGRKIPVDLLSAFLGMKSEKICQSFPEENYKSGGAHLGLFDCGGGWYLKDWHVDLYYQKPFTNRKGFGEAILLKHDKIVGINTVNSSKRLINQLLLEYIKTDHQGGFSETGLKQDNKTESYSNPSMYYRGNSYHGRSMGLPLFLTRDDVCYNDETGPLHNDRFFVNNRVVAWHLGLSGWVSKKCRYRILETYSINYGTYAGLNVEQPGYFFREGEKQHYLLIDLNYHFTSCPMIISLRFGKDNGQVNKSSAIMVEVTWNI